MYGMVSLIDIVGGGEHVMVGPTSFVSDVIILVNKRVQCVTPCKPKPAELQTGFTYA